MVWTASTCYELMGMGDVSESQHEEQVDTKVADRTVVREMCTH